MPLAKRDNQQISGKVPSIRRRIIRTLVIALGMQITAAALLLDYFVDRALLAHFDGELKAQARSLQTLTLLEGHGVELHFADEVMSNFSAQANPDYFELLDEQGVAIERSVSLRQKNLLSWRAVENSDSAESVRDIVLPDGQAGRVISLRFRPGLGDSVDDLDVPARSALAKPLLTLRVARSSKTIDDTALQIDFYLVLTVLLCLVGCSSIVWWRIGKELAVIEQLGQRLEQASADALVANVALDMAPENLPSELRAFVSSVQRSSNALTAALERERRWSRDLAHEMRTPIAELRTLVNVAQAFPDARTNQEVFAEAEAISKEMETLVSTLLLMARMESGQERIEAHVFDLCETLASYRQKFADWSWQLPDACLVECEESLLKLVLSNLMNNAAVNAPVGSGSVQVKVQQMNAEAVEFTVTNFAPNLSAVDIAHMHRRFWRKLCPDSNSTSRTGGGLGLAISYAVCQLLGLELSFRLDESKILQASVKNIPLVE